MIDVDNSGYTRHSNNLKLVDITNCSKIAQNKCSLQLTYLNIENHYELHSLCTGLEVQDIRSGNGKKELKVVVIFCKG